MDVFSLNRPAELRASYPSAFLIFPSVGHWTAQISLVQSKALPPKHQIQQLWIISHFTVPKTLVSLGIGSLMYTVKLTF